MQKRVAFLGGASRSSVGGSSQDVHVYMKASRCHAQVFSYLAWSKTHLYTCLHMQTTPMSVCFSSPKTMCSLGQEMLKCQRSAHPLRNSSTLTPSGPSGHTPSHSQAVCWYCCHTSHMWPHVCGDVCRSTPELVSTCSEWQRLRLI